jgi:hypothetical protein
MNAMTTVDSSTVRNEVHKIPNRRDIQTCIKEAFKNKHADLRCTRCLARVMTGVCVLLKVWLMHDHTTSRDFRDNSGFSRKT